MQLVRPYTTAAIIRLSHSEHIWQVLVDAGRGTVEADLIATQCSHTAFWLLLAGVDGTHPAPIPTAPANLQLVVEKRGTRVYRKRFAKYIGTSAPRLSTYVNGLVTPSAAMMLRIRRCASDLAQATAAANGLKSVG